MGISALCMSRERVEDIGDISCSFSIDFLLILEVFKEKPKVIISTHTPTVL